jgi:hypothetical protein
VKLNQQTKKTVLSDQNEDEGSRSTKERKGYISKRSDIKQIQSQDCRSLIQGGDPNEEREISPSMEKIKKGVRLTQPVASQWTVSWSKFRVYTTENRPRTTIQSSYQRNYTEE